MSPRSISRLVTCGCVLAALSQTLWGQTAAPAPAVAESAAETIGNEVRAVFERCQRAIIKIEAVDVHGSLSGTGFFIDPNGTLYTSYTIGGETRDIVVCQGAMKYPARRIVADPRSGIAILKVDAATSFLSPGKSHDLHVTSPIITVGFPMDLPLTPSFGTIAGFDLKYLGRFFATTHIRANVSVQRGEGGAPLLNMQGEVVGILISSLDSGSASFALPIEAAEKVHKDFMRFGEIRPGWMGVNVAALVEPIAGSHAQIEETIESGPAERAGLKKGDVFLEIGGKKISGVEDVLDASFFMTADDELTVKVARQDEQLELKMRPSEHPAQRRASVDTSPNISALTLKADR